MWCLVSHPTESRNATGLGLCSSPCLSVSVLPMLTFLTHWGRVTHICVNELTVIVSDNGLSPGRRQAIIWNNARLLLIEPLGTNFSEISIGIQTFSFKKMHLNMSSAKWRPFCLGLNVLTHWGRMRHTCVIEIGHRQGQVMAWWSAWTNDNSLATGPLVQTSLIFASK